MAEMHAMLGLPPNWEPQTPEEVEDVYESAIDLLRTDSKSKYFCVTASGKKWQAKVTARGHQVVLGRFTEARLAAAEVLLFLVGTIEAPPSPTKPRNKKGQGPRPDSRHGKHRQQASARSPAARVSPASVTALPQQAEVCDTVPAGAIVWSCEAFTSDPF